MGFLIFCFPPIVPCCPSPSDCWDKPFHRSLIFSRHGSYDRYSQTALGSLASFCLPSPVKWKYLQVISQGRITPLQSNSLLRPGRWTPWTSFSAGGKRYLFSFCYGEQGEDPADWNWFLPPSFLSLVYSRRLIFIYTFWGEGGKDGPPCVSVAGNKLITYLLCISNQFRL